MIATVGILLFDVRNNQIFDVMLQHAQALERQLGLAARSGTNALDGVLSQFAPPHRRLFGIVTVAQERAIGLVYGAALGGWSYLVAWGALRTLEFNGARQIDGLIGARTAVAVIREVQRSGSEANKRPAVDTAVRPSGSALLRSLSEGPGFDASFQGACLSSSVPLSATGITTGI